MRGKVIVGAGLTGLAAVWASGLPILEAKEVQVEKVPEGEPVELEKPAGEP